MSCSPICSSIQVGYGAHILLFERLKNTVSVQVRLRLHIVDSISPVTSLRPTGVPVNFNFVYPATLALGTTMLELTITDESGDVVSDARVTLLMGDDIIFSTGNTDENGQTNQGANTEDNSNKKNKKESEIEDADFEVVD